MSIYFLQAVMSWKPIQRQDPEQDKLHRRGQTVRCEEQVHCVRSFRAEEFRKTRSKKDITRQYSRGGFP